MTDDSSRISPTAHYTSAVWVRNGLSHPALATPRGRRLHAILRGANAAYGLLGHATLDDMLLARHRVIDHLLETEISEGRVRQVIEIAAGMSPRGFRMTARHPELRYLEADLPEQADLKRRLLDGAGLFGARHEVVSVDALEDDGPTSLAAVAATLEPGAGTAIVTEGLINYFDRATVESMWRRIAGVLRRVGGGVYLSDLVLGGDSPVTVRAFRQLLSWFARGAVHLHYDGPAQAEGALLAAGFDVASAHRPDEFAELDIPRPDRQFVRVLEGRVSP